MKINAPSYQTLEKLFEKLLYLDQVQAVLSWDNAVTMPISGAANRAEQMVTIKSLQHAILSDDGVKQLFEAAESERKKLSGWQNANLNEMQRVFKHTTIVPQKLLREFTKAGSECEIIWRTARKENNFKSLIKPLQRVVDLTKEIAKIKSESFKCSPYDALLDQYDPGRKSAQIDAIFKDLGEFLPDFTKQVLEKQKKKKGPVEIKGPFAKENQKQLAVKILENIGFDFNAGRLDESSHPFCGGYPSDIRITTRYNEDCFVSGLMGVIHEGGHAMYEAGLPKNWAKQPVGAARGMSLHESQSLLLEMQVGRSKEFVSFLTPLVKSELGIKGKGCTPANLYQILNNVEPSLIRVDADEVTYPSHILLRYYIEKYLIEDDMQVEDLPEAWSQGMEKFLGIKPDSDANGCMQDIHWMDGSFGYFPTYTLGAIYAAQIFKSAKDANKDLTAEIKKGNLSNLKTWLNENIHDKASRFETDDLVKKATGSELDVGIYKDYLKDKFL